MSERESASRIKTDVVLATRQLASSPTPERPVDDLTRLLSDLVAIPSVNPMGRPLAGPRYPRDPADRLPGGLVSRAGRRVPSGSRCSPGRDNLLAWYEAPGSAAD